MVAASDDLVVIGKITTVYGVKGWVKIHSYTEPMENFVSYQDFYLERSSCWAPVVFDQFKHHQKGLIGLIDSVENREQARAFCQCNVAVPVSQLSELGDGEYYWHQLEGLSVWAKNAGDDNNELLLGKVHHMMDTGANDVLVVRASKGSIDKRERLIPYLPEQVIKRIDIDAGVVTVEWDPEF